MPKEGNSCVIVQFTMSLTVIISYYKALDNLKVILKALSQQSSRDFEVILSEDDFNEETIRYFSDHSHTYSFPIRHLHQSTDLGFRKNEMLNRSLRECKTEVVAFIDGDCIPHRHFVKAFIQHTSMGSFFAGRAVMLGEKISAEIVHTQKLDKLNFFSLITTDSQKVKEAIYNPLFPMAYKTRGLSGRNWGIYKKHLFDINGFDEDYTNAGVGEDVDIEWRLMASGVKRVSIKNKAIVFHIYHPRAYGQEGVQANYRLLEQKKKLTHLRCLHGIENLENSI